MTELHIDRWRTKPYEHQVAGVRLLLDNPFFALYDEMGVGKSYQVVNAACELFMDAEIDTVLIVAPAAVRGVWINSEFGEIKKHSWAPNCVIEYHNPIRVIWSSPFKDDGATPLDWCVTNYEFLRNEEHRAKLIGLLRGRKVMMVLDESSFIKNRKAAQTKACNEVGKQAARRVILNGTPIANNPLDIWSQVNFLSHAILPYRNFFHFRADYAVLGGYQGRQVIKFKNLDKLQDHVRPYAIRREKKDCLDLPEKIYLTPVEVPLSEKNWKRYKEMRDDAVVWLEKNPSMAAQAGVKVMRLSQITSGFLGGFVDMEEEEVQGHALPVAEEIGREKLDFLRGWVAAKLEEEPSLKIIVWCRFRQELERVARDLADLLPTYRLYGQGKKERAEAIERFSRLGDGKPGLLAGQVQAGGLGLNLIAAWVEVYLSNDFNLLSRLQSEDRVHRPGQTRNVLVLDVLATGPNGQKTIDHRVVKRLREKQDIASWTVAAWKRELVEEEAAA